jgi:pimeloyl-ACP methyl ester carboxylesterase
MTMPLIFIHGQDSSSQTYKATLLRAAYPDAIVPDFAGLLDQRMDQLAPILADGDDWVIVGSSMGGLMGALWACAHPAQVRRLILLAPAIHLPEFAAQLPPPIAVPVTVYHGLRDTVVPLMLVRVVAERVFRNLAFHVVDDDHRLHATAEALDWRALVEGAS